jgi:hypothetical protein
MQLSRRVLHGAIVLAMGRGRAAGLGPLHLARTRLLLALFKVCVHCVITDDNAQQQSINKPLET